MIITKKCVVLGVLCVLGHVVDAMIDELQVDPKHATFNYKGKSNGLTTIEFSVTDGEGRVNLANEKMGVCYQRPIPIRELGLLEVEDEIHILRQNVILAKIPDHAWNGKDKGLFQAFFTLYRADITPFSFGSLFRNGYELIVAFMKWGNAYTDVMFRTKGRKCQNKYLTHIPITKLMIEEIAGTQDSALKIFHIQTDKKEDETMEQDEKSTTKCKSNIFSSNGETLEFTDQTHKREFMKLFRDLKQTAEKAAHRKEKSTRTREVLTKVFTDADARGKYPQTKVGNLIASYLPLDDEAFPAGENPLGNLIVAHASEMSEEKVQPAGPTADFNGDFSDNSIGSADVPVSGLFASEAGKEETKWSCPLCTFLNNSDQPKCRMCSTPHPQCEVVGGKPVLPRPRDDIPDEKVQEEPKWNCMECATTNSGKVTSCSACRTLKTPKLARGNSNSRLSAGLPEKASSAKSGVWKCPYCTVENKSSHMICSVCENVNPTHQWTCDRCTFAKNCADWRNCSLCGSSKPGTTKRPTVREIFGI